MGHWIRAGIAVRTHVLKWPELPWRPDSGQNRFLQILGFGGGALLPIAYCLLPIAYCLLPIAYCLLPRQDAYCLDGMHSVSTGCILPYVDAYCMPWMHTDGPAGRPAARPAGRPHLH